MKLGDRLWRAAFLTVGFFAVAAVANSLLNLELFDVMTHPATGLLAFLLSFLVAPSARKRQDQ